MHIVYDIISLIIALAYLPGYICKKKFHPGFAMRLGFLPEGYSFNRPIWIHAVSVGEAMAVKQLVEQLREAFPEKKFIISTVTPTGNAIAASLAKAGDHVLYLPLDFSFIVRKMIKKTRPSLFIIVETELWPNLISYLACQAIPVAMVNGRISDRSFRGYRKVAWLCAGIFNKMALLCVQTERDAERLSSLGAQTDKMHVTGNMKFDSVSGAQDKVARLADKFRSILKLKEEEKLLVAGSTHPQEEAIVLAVYKELVREFPNLRLLLAPRHPQRAPEIKTIIQEYGFRAVSLTHVETLSSEPSVKPVFILDTVGQLMSVYALADVVFVGGSLIEKGGHNILEPAALAKPILTGKYMYNFQDIADLFLQNKAAIMVQDQSRLRDALKRLLQRPQEALELGKRALAIVEQNQGATERTIGYLKKIL